MSSQLHEYPVTVQWAGGRDGRGTVRTGHSGESIDVAVPPEFQGPGGATNPEELLTGAITSCYSITFGIIATNRRLPVKNLQVDSVGEVEQQGANFTYKSITLRPRVTLGTDATDEQVAMAQEMAHKADLYCIVTNAVRGKVEIAIEPTVVRE